MRRSPMRRGKEAGVSETKNLVGRLRERQDEWVENHLAIPVDRDALEAADTIEALQQRCEEHENARLRLSEQIVDDGKRIAALEGEMADAPVWALTDEELAKIIAEAKRDGRQEGFAEAREIAKQARCEKETDADAYGRAFNDGRSAMRRAILYALQPPRDEGKREGGDG